VYSVHMCLFMPILMKIKKMKSFGCSTHFSLSHWLARTHTLYTAPPILFRSDDKPPYFFSLSLCSGPGQAGLTFFLLVNGHKRHQDGRRLTILFVLLTHSPALLPIAFKQINPRHVAQEIVDKDDR